MHGKKRIYISSSSNEVSFYWLPPITVNVLCKPSLLHHCSKMSGPVLSSDLIPYFLYSVVHLMQVHFQISSSAYFMRRVLRSTPNCAFLEIRFSVGRYLHALFQAIQKFLSLLRSPHLMLACWLRCGLTTGNVSFLPSIRSTACDAPSVPSTILILKYVASF